MSEAGRSRPSEMLQNQVPEFGPATRGVTEQDLGDWRRQLMSHVKRGLSTRLQPYFGCM